jgi:CheY-like chemotaxis protein
MPDHKPTILMVDDDAWDRQLFRTLLEEAGYRVVEASSGKDALHAVLNTRLDLVILDLSMPEMDGLEVLRAAKHMTKPQVIALTGLDPVIGRSMLEAARLLGAAATLDKRRARDLLVLLARKLVSSQDGKPS